MDLDELLNKHENEKGILQNSIQEQTEQLLEAQKPLARLQYENQQKAQLHDQMKDKIGNLADKNKQNEHQIIELQIQRQKLKIEQQELQSLKEKVEMELAEALESSEEERKDHEQEKAKHAATIRAL